MAINFNQTDDCLRCELWNRAYCVLLRLLQKWDWCILSCRLMRQQILWSFYQQSCALHTIYLDCSYEFRFGVVATRCFFFDFLYITFEFSSGDVCLRLTWIPSRDLFHDDFSFFDAKQIEFFFRLCWPLVSDQSYTERAHTHTKCLFDDRSWPTLRHSCRFDKVYQHMRLAHFDNEVAIRQSSNPIGVHCNFCCCV